MRSRRSNAARVYLLVAIAMGAFFSKDGVCKCQIVIHRKNSELLPADADSTLCVFRVHWLFFTNTHFSILRKDVEHHVTFCFGRILLHLSSLFSSLAQLFDVVSWVILVAKVYQACESDKLCQLLLICLTHG